MSKLLVTLTAGFAAGVVAGVLFAPEMGETTRDNIRSKANDLGEELEKQYAVEIDKLKKRVSDLSQELKSQLDDSGMAQKVDDLKNKVTEAAQDMHEKVSPSKA